MVSPPWNLAVINLASSRLPLEVARCNSSWKPMQMVAIKAWPCSKVLSVGLFPRECGGWLNPSGSPRPYLFDTGMSLTPGTPDKPITDPSYRHHTPYFENISVSAQEL